MGYLPKDVHIVGYARTKMDDAEYHKRLTSYIKIGDTDSEGTEKLNEFKAFSTYIAGAYDESSAFEALNAHLGEIEAKYHPGAEKNRVFYFALPPSVFIPVAQHLREQCYAPGVNRIIVEKPFGKDLASSRELLGALKKHWTEDETFRIDHYLGKEMVKNMLVLRFANVAFSSGWDNHSISNVQITFKEPFGTEGRGGYFDEFGIIRDILQNRQYSFSFFVCLLNVPERARGEISYYMRLNNDADTLYHRQICCRCSVSLRWSDPFHSRPRTFETRR